MVPTVAVGYMHTYKGILNGAGMYLLSIFTTFSNKLLSEAQSKNHLKKDKSFFVILFCVMMPGRYSILKKNISDFTEEVCLINYVNG